MSDEWKAPRVMVIEASEGLSCHACGRSRQVVASIDSLFSFFTSNLCAACVTYLNGQFQEHARAR